MTEIIPDCIDRRSGPPDTNCNQTTRNGLGAYLLIFRLIVWF